MNLRKIAAALLLILAIGMLYIGITKGMLPPSLTGIGFLAIATVFASTR